MQYIKYFIGIIKPIKYSSRHSSTVEQNTVNILINVRFILRALIHHRGQFMTTTLVELTRFTQIFHIIHEKFFIFYLISFNFYYVPLNKIARISNFTI